jgi:hypothetical protein
MRGIGITIFSPFAHEPDGEDDLQREHDGEKQHFAHVSEGELDLRIKLCKAELAALKALRDGNEPLARKHNAEMEKYDKALLKLRGRDKEDDDDDQAE